MGAQMKGELTVVKIDTEKNPTIASKHQIGGRTPRPDRHALPHTRTSLSGSLWHAPLLRSAAPTVPTFILFKEGAPVDRIEGLLPAHQLVQRLRYMIGSPQ